MKEIVAPRPKMYSNLTDDDHVDKEAKGKKKVIKREIRFQDYKDCLENSKTMQRSQQEFRSKAHSVLTEKVNKIAFSANGDKRI